MGKTLPHEIECAYELLGILRELIVCFQEDSFIGELTYKIGLWNTTPIAKKITQTVY